MRVGATGDVITPDVCRRTVPIFDGRQRYDLTLAFKRMDQVKSEHGYAGPVVVCMVRYFPISGHRPDRPAIKYLTEQRDIELALAPLAGTRIVVPYRISVPTAQTEPRGLSVMVLMMYSVDPESSAAWTTSSGTSG